MRDTHEFRIVITSFCNYRCFFCHHEGRIEESTKFLLSPNDYAFIASVAKRLWGWDTITITGGEPLVSPIYREVCERIAREGTSITTVTNASLLSSPRKFLAHNRQINVSLHTMDPIVYQKITGSSYGLQQTLDTIVSIRDSLPEIEIHLNATVIRGYNDSPQEMDRLIQFSNKVHGKAKFVDLASDDRDLVVPCEEIGKNLMSIGFVKIDEGKWQTVFRRNTEHVTVTRCGFSNQNFDRGHRNLFLHPDGIIVDSYQKDVVVDALREIKGRDTEGLANKIESYFPPAKESSRRTISNSP